METLSSIDKDLATFASVRAQYDPWYEFSDDHRVWLNHFSLRRELTYIRARLGLWGQDLTVPVCNRATGSLEYV
jgi:hypothetical protein